MRPDHADTTLRIVDRRVVRLPSVVLVATHLDGSERRATLGMNPLVVGTSTDCELVVHDPGVSRRHCVLTLTARGVIVRDLQSKNGTAVNGTDVLEAFVSPGAVVKIGSTSLCLHLSGPPSDVALWPGATFGDVLGGSIPMRALFARLEASARTSSSILFRGERDPDHHRDEGGVLSRGLEASVALVLVLPESYLGHTPPRCTERARSPTGPGETSRRSNRAVGMDLVSRAVGSVRS